MSVTKPFDPNDYVTISERIETFKGEFPRRAIQTEVIKDTPKMIVVKATIWPDADRPDCFFTGHAEEDRSRGEINAGGSALENCETSAVGRALAFMGYATQRSGRQADEARISEATRRKALALCAGLRIDDAERGALIQLLFEADDVDELTEPQGLALIEHLKNRGRPRTPARKVA